MKYVRSLFSVILILGAIAGMAVPVAYASTENNSMFGTIVSEQIVQLADNQEAVITVYSSSTSTYATSYMRAGTKKYAIRNSSGDIMFELILQGAFQVNQGVSAVCISASHDYEIYDSNWRYINGLSHANANKAYANATFKEVIDSIPVFTQEVSVVLTCDENGNLS